MIIFDFRWIGLKIKHKIMRKFPREIDGSGGRETEKKGKGEIKKFVRRERRGQALSNRLILISTSDRLAGPDLH